MKTARELGQLRENTSTALSKIPGYRDEEKLGRKLSDAFGATTHLRLDGIYYEEDPKSKNGTTVADSVTYTVSNKEAQSLLSGALQGTLRTANVENVYPVYTDTLEDGTHIVTVHNYDEYVNRVVGNAVDQLVAKDDLEETGTVLPPSKHTHQHWKDVENETFHPDVEARLQQVNNAYNALEIEANYRDHPDMKPQRAPRDGALGTDSAAVFPAIRDVFRPLIAHHRGGTHTNLEQNPDKDKRLLIEDGVNLTRGKVVPENTSEGPPTPRTLNLSERSQEKGKRKLNDIREHPIKEGLSATGMLIGAGVESIVDLGLKGLPATAEAGKELKKDRKEWKAQQRNFEESQERIAKKLSEET